jgi:hypothetical protein
MSKQTAVEWLYELSKERELDKFDLEQAKYMEKNQIEKAFCKGFITEGDLVIICEQYIEETYK